jgi:protein-S-isoprenylcysteine O-methyltransferase Ste14
MGFVGLALAICYFALAVVIPLVGARRRTGRSAFRSTGGVGRIAQVSFGAGNLLLIVGPAIDLFSQRWRIRALDVRALHVIGILGAATAIALIVVSRRVMGEAWRIGVDTAEETLLVTRGPFAHVRHPIYSAMVLLAVGVALVVPNVLTLCAIGCFVAAVEVQARLIEDPYLRRTHDGFARYASTTGRFVPAVGRLRDR